MKINRELYPYRDRQRERAWWVCPRCGGEQYREDPEGPVCRRCRKEMRKREENAMTIEEMAVEYRAQAQRLRERLRELDQGARSAGSKSERDRLYLRRRTLEPIWRETRDLAVLLEHYYERGYRRNERYTL